MDIQIINTLFDNGTFTEMYRAGWITPKIFEDREIYLFIDLLMKTKGLSKYKACMEASEKFDKHITTIYKSIKKFE